MTTLLIPEILKQVHEAPLKQKKPGQKTKKSILKNHKDDKTLQWVIYGAMAPNVEFPGLMETGIDNIVFRPDDSPEGLSPSHLGKEIKQMRFFVKDSIDGAKIDNKKRLELLVNLLESVHVSEACLIGDIFKKKLNIDGLDEKLVNEIWPDLLPKKEKGDANN